MTRKGGLRALDDRFLGPTAIAVIAGLVALHFVWTGISALIGRAWVVAAILLVLTVLCSQAAIREWRRRSR